MQIDLKEGQRHTFMFLFIQQNHQRVFLYIFKKFKRIRAFWTNFQGKNIQIDIERTKIQCSTLHKECNKLNATSIEINVSTTCINKMKF